MPVSTRVLITGATGFIGSHVARRLLRQGFEVHALCRSRAAFERLLNVRRQLRIHTASLSDRGGLRRTVLAIAPKYIVHLAAATMRAGTAAEIGDIVLTNAIGTLNLIDACDAVDYAGFVNTGDALEYGLKRRPAKESDPCRPTTFDGRAKAVATLYARYAALARDRPIVTLRLFSVFGPRDHPTRLLPRVIASALENDTLRLSHPAVGRDFLYVDDVAALIESALHASTRLRGEVLNAGSGRRITLKEVVDRVRSLTKSRSEACWGAYPLAAHDRGCWTADVTKLHALLAWRPRFTFEEGLRTTIRHILRSR
jgi:nucleoside-diphosphate-sugar epimerase